MNIMLTLFRHQWLSFWRRRNSGQSLGMQIFVGLIMLYLMAVAFGLGLAMSKLIEKLAPGADAVQVFLGFVLYYFAFDMLMRFMLQELPTLSIQPYLDKPIRRRKLVQFLNIRSLFHFLNLLPFFLFLPFSLTTLYASAGGKAALAFILSLVFLVMFNHFLVLYVKRKSLINNWWLLGFFVMVLLGGFADYHGWISIRNFSARLFSYILSHPWATLLPAVMAIAAFGNNNRFLYSNLYIEEISKAGGKKSGSEYTWLNRFGEIGELIALDLKLILRNKRSRSVLVLSLIFLFYGLILYKPDMIADNQFGILLIGAVFITGIFIINYGNFLFAWQSSHFDGLMTSRLKIKTYIRSKLSLFFAASTVSFVLSTFYGLISWKLVVIQLAAYLFNIGVISILSVYLATFHYKRLELERSATFNYQGTGAIQWVYALLILLVPFALYIPFSLLFNQWVGITVLGILGLASLLLRDWWIEFLVQQFSKRKYLILEGFREK